MKMLFKRARGACCLFLSILFLSQLLSCAAPAQLSSPDDPADELSDFIVRGEGEELTVLGVKDSNKKVYLVPEGVRRIDTAAFLGCHNAQKISIPASVKSIGVGIFRGCDSLTEITVAKTNSVYASYENALVHKPTRTLVSGCAKSVIPADGSVTAIGDNAFAAQTRLETITLPDTVLTVGNNAFYGCTALKSVTLSQSLTHIGDGAFAKCERLPGISFPDSLLEIGERAFVSCRSLYSVFLGKSLQNIKKDAFLECTKLIEVCNTSALSPALGGTTLGYVAFYAKNVCPSKEQSVLVKKDGFVFYVIEGAPLLIAYEGDKTELTLPESLEDTPYAVYEYAFFATPVKSVKIPKTVTSLGVGTFASCTALRSVTLPSTLSTLPKNVFYNCVSLTTLDLPPTLASIAENAFLGASSLFEVDGNVQYVDNWAVGAQKKCAVITLRDGTRGIADAAFSPLGSAITRLSLPEGLKYIGSSAFEGCTQMRVSTLPSTLLRIESNAFASCRSISELTLPEGLQRIGDNAFSGCTGMTNLVAKGNTFTLGLRVFLNCKIKTVSFPAHLISELSSDALIEATVTSGDNLPQMAFFECKALRTVTIPATVQRIGASAFQRCSSLATVHFLGTRTQWEAVTVGLHNKELKTADVICKE